MSHLLTAYGEEYLFKNSFDDSTTYTIGLYDDSSEGTTGDAIDDTSDYSAITTEPDASTTNYSTHSDTFTVENPSGSQIVANNDTQASFDFSDVSTSQTVDSYYVTVSFQSDVYGSDGSANQHLLFTGALSQPRDIGSIDTLNISAGGIELEVE